MEKNLAIHLSKLIVFKKTMILLKIHHSTTKSYPLKDRNLPGKIVNSEVLSTLRMETENQLKIKTSCEIKKKL